MEVTIRHSEQADIPAIKGIYEQPVCYAGTLQLPYPSEALWQARLGSMPDNTYSLVALVDGEVVGQIGMEICSKPRRRHAANLGMAVSDRHQGKGIGSRLLEAMIILAHDWLAVTRIELEVYKDNSAGVALYKRHGFVIEGEGRAYAFRNGAYADVYFMAKVTI